jgi:hypothetical protein
VARPGGDRMGVGPVVTNCDTYRPFGDVSPYIAGLDCNLYDQLFCGRNSGLSGVMLWTHYMDVASSTDILDGFVRIPGSDILSYGDGDGVVIPSGGTTTYMVIWVAEYTDTVTSVTYKRVYLLRDHV